MKNKTVFILFCTAILTFNAFAQKAQMSLPVSWKVGDTWKYQLKQKNVGGMFGPDYNTHAVKSFRIKVIGKKIAPNPSYLVEWQYLSYTTSETDTLEENCAILLKKFLLQTPIVIQLGVQGDYQDLVGKAEMKKKFLAFYTKEAKGNPNCLQMANMGISMFGSFSAYFEHITPEVKNFFTAFTLLPRNIHEEQTDSVEVFQDIDQKAVMLPQTILIKPTITNDSIRVIFDMSIDEAAYKKHFAANMEAGWQKEGYSRADTNMADMYKKLDNFQPKNSHKLDVTFAKKTGVLSSFDFIEEEWVMLRGGESHFYYYRKEH